MNLPLKHQSALAWFSTSLIFFKNNFSKIITLGAFAAFGRAIQLGAFGVITPRLHIILEVVIETSRIMIFLYTLGLTDFRSGVSKILQFFARKTKRKQYWNLAVKTLRTNWIAVILNLLAFGILAALINKFIELAAYQTCMLYKLKAGRIISATSSEWVLLLFFKNLSVIPLTLIFNAIFLLWVTKKLKSKVA